MVVRMGYEKEVSVPDVTLKIKRLGELVGVPLTEGGISFDEYSTAKNFMEVKSGLSNNERRGYYPGD